MNSQQSKAIDEFRFRDLHPGILIGTASDRYAGWIGQIYSEAPYKNRITKRAKKVAKESFKENVLPVDSVEEYFQHFSVLELDFTFYSPLLDQALKPTRNLHVLRTYRKYLKQGDQVILKVPQVVFAQRLWRGGKFIENPGYLNPDIFIRQFYEPVQELLGDLVKGFIFEQEYQPKKNRGSQEEYAKKLDEFLTQLPKDDRYHMEVRTEYYLSTGYFEVLRKHGIGQVLSHWTWLPPLRKQFAKGGTTFLNAGNQLIIRLMTPLRMRYEQAYAKAHPFDNMVEGMMSHHMVEETTDLMLEAIKQGAETIVIINNRAGGNAPMIAQKVSGEFLRRFIEFQQ